MAFDFNVEVLILFNYECPDLQHEVERIAKAYRYKQVYYQTFEPRSKTSLENRHIHGNRAYDETKLSPTEFCAIFVKDKSPS